MGKQSKHQSWKKQNGTTALASTPCIAGKPPDGAGAIPSQTLVWIDDYEPVLSLYKKLFELSGFHVLTASAGTAGVELVAKNHVDAVITDYEMPGMDGKAVASSVKRLRPSLPVIMFSGDPTISTQGQDVVDAFCDKGGSREELLAIIHKLIGTGPDQSPCSGAPRNSGGRRRAVRLELPAPEPTYSDSQSTLRRAK